jgi:hypothetical protein
MKTIFIVFTFLIIGCSFRSNSSHFNQAEIEYFTEIALGAEFGDETPVIKKWVDDIRIKVDGEPTEEDLQTVNNIIKDLNEIIIGIKIKLVDKKANLTITFSPESDFSSIDSNYVPTDFGFFWALWHDDNFTIYDASILISSVDITQKARSHLIREELTQSLGLMNDSNKYKDSVFFQEWTDIVEFSEIDRSVIKLLYINSVKPGMTKEQVRKILE